MVADPAEAHRRKNMRAKHSWRPGKQQGVKMERFLALIEQGVKRIEAAAAVGVQTNTIDQWLRRYDGFRARYHRAQQKARGEVDMAEVPFDAEFRRRYFHHETPAHIDKLIEVINEQVRIARETKARDRRVLILMPPEHAKSTVGVEEYVTYRVTMDPGFRCSVVCADAGQAKKRLGAISRMLTDRTAYEELVNDYGPFRSELRAEIKPWTQTHITHIYAPPSQRDYTVQALGWNGSIYGDRQDLIVFDDIATMKNQTPSIIEAQWEKIWGEFRSRITRGGLIIVIGTHMRENDIYTVMQEKGFFTDTIVIPAIVREPGTLSDDDPGEALWEDFVPMRELLKIRETDLRLFELQYQQNPLPSVGAIFTQEMFEACFDEKRYIGHVPGNSLVVCGIDPSVTNYTAGVVFALTQTDSGDMMRYLVDVRNEKGLTGEGGDNHAGVVEFIVEMCRDYKVHTLCVEDGTWMSLINNSLTLRSKLHELGVVHWGVPVNEETTGQEAIRQLSGLFNYRLINLPGSPNARAHLQTMLHQFLTFTGDKRNWRRHFDIVKAFRQAEHAVQYSQRQGKAYLPMSTGDDVPAFLETVAVG